MQGFSSLNTRLAFSLLCLPMVLKAQGTEKALEALYSVLVGISVWLLTGVVILVSAAVRYRSKKIALVGYSYTGISFLVAVLLTLRNTGEYYSGEGLLNDMAGSFFTGSLVYLILLLLVQRKWKIETPAETEREPAEKVASGKRRGWIQFWILLYLIIYLYAELSNLVTIGSHGFEIPFRLYLTLCLQFLIIAIALYGFWKKTVWGWTLINFSATWYILIGIYQVYSVLIVYPDLERIPPSFYIRQLLSMLICLSVLFLCRRPVLLESFKIDSGKSNRLFWAVLGSALLLCLVNLLLNTFFTGV